MTPSTHASDARSQVFFILISAGIFAYLGFAFDWSHQYTATTPPVFIPMVAVLKWTLQGGAVAFGIAAVLSIAGLAIGPLLYSVAGIITAVLFVVVGIWDVTNPHNYYCGVAPILLFVFAAWNGYGAWMGLRDWWNVPRLPGVD